MVLEGQKHLLNKNYRILDIKNNILTARSLAENEILFLDLSTNKIKLKTSEVMLCTNGYIIKSQNGKYIYLDNNLNPLTKEYEYIYSKGSLKTNSIIDEVVNW